jgi:hypothetical protein
MSFMEKSKTFCVIPFVHFSTKPSGDARLCCLSSHSYIKNEHGEKLNVSKYSISEIWNSETMQNFRSKMLKNEFLQECRVCYENEAHGDESKRIIENRKFSSDVKEIQEGRWATSNSNMPMPKYYDLRMGNKCNLKCRSCNPVFSSSWKLEYEKYKDDPVFRQYDGAYNISVNGMRWEESPLFLKELLENVDRVEELYITGGEPLLIEEHFVLLQEIVDRGYQKKIRLRYNTNLTVLPRKFLDLVSQFDKVQINCSFDGIGLRSDWLRHPSKWSILSKNFYKLVEELPKAKIVINCAISIFNVLYVHELFDFSREVTTNTGKFIEVTVDIVHEPDYMSLNNLPLNLKTEAISRIKNIFEQHCLKDFEKKQLLQLLHRLENIPAELNSLRALSAHILKFDEIREENFLLAFPELNLLLNQE